MIVFLLISGVFIIFTTDQSSAYTVDEDSEVTLTKEDIYFQGKNNVSNYDNTYASADEDLDDEDEFDYAPNQDWNYHNAITLSATVQSVYSTDNINGVRIFVSATGYFEYADEYDEDWDDPDEEPELSYAGVTQVPITA